MASGTLGQFELTAGTNTTVYTVPSAKIATVTVSFANKSVASKWIRLAVAASGTPSTSEYLLYEVLLGPFGTLEKSGIVASAAKNFVAYSTGADVSVNIYGFEE